MEAALLIMVREGFEAALVVAIVFAYLRKVGRLDLSRAVWGGVVAAVAVSVTVGVVVRATVGELEGTVRLHAFAAISALAAVVLTWMIFWMRRQSRLIKGDLEHRVDTALGAENIGVAPRRRGARRRPAGGHRGRAVPACGRHRRVRGRRPGGRADRPCPGLVLAYAVYWGGRSIPLRAFFKVTGLLLIVFAAGLVAKTVMFLQVSGDIGSLSLNGVYDLTSYRWLTQETEVGKFLSAMFGWDPRPSLEQAVAWVAFLVPVTILFLRPAPAPRPVAWPSDTAEPSGVRGTEGRPATLVGT